MTFPIFFTGFGAGLGLIVAIGAQNAFVLRQGLLKQHVLAVCLACAVSDAVLITLGVSGFRLVSTVMPWLDPAMRIGGALFLFWYGARSFLSAWRGGAALLAEQGAARPLWPTLLTCLALTWLNPHVYLDTVMLLGAISTRYEGAEHIFGLGAATASFAFFFSLGYGARLLRPLFARPQAWRTLDALIGLVMWTIALSLIAGR
jgi:L-lysine exporter family protein LysE/ArgO